MPDEVTRRPARKEDFDFALTLYLQSTKPLLIAIGRWDAETIPARFAKGLKIEQIQILSLNDADIGWMQVSETADELHLDQLHLVGDARNTGIGTGLVRELQGRAITSGKVLALNVMRGNRAQQLYERLGFRVAGGDAEKIRMIWRKGQSDFDQPTTETAK